MLAQAVSVQKLSVPDLVVIDQFNQQQNNRLLSLDGRLNSFSPIGQQQQQTAFQKDYQQNSQTNQPEAASLINNSSLSYQQQLDLLNGSGSELQQQQQQQNITFECLISFDKKKDKNLIVKWHHDDRSEPIYQWIPELNKRSIAPQYRAYIVPTVNNNNHGLFHNNHQLASASINAADATSGIVNITNLAEQQLASNNNNIQLLEAGFKLIRPSKELGGELF